MSARSFDAWDLSQQTRRGLQQAGFKEPTLIQKLAIGPALSGSDIVGAAKTGSGKTLAFLIPLLEKLRAQTWTREYGVGALVLTPTRELAAQVFLVLKRIGKFHPFSAGAAFGGSTPAALKAERKTISRAQILIATPGRLVDHLESGNLSLDNLQLLVVDEADKLLEMGFQDQLDRILAFVPADRQTLLFSATQSRSTKELSRLILRPKPVLVQAEVVSENANHFVLPERLRQFYVECALDEKLNVLWSFIQMNGHKKSLAFFDTCKQVKFAFEAFRQLRLQITVLQLHGKMKQHKRMETYHQFRRKQAVVLLATDVAARGLDFPDVDWVLQVDAARDVRTYVHRVGRTARYKKDGQAVTLVLPQERAGFVQKLKEGGIAIKEIKVRPDRMTNITPKLTRLVSSQRGMLQGMAERAFEAYLQEMCLFRAKSDSACKPWEYDIDAFAASFGLIVTPKLTKKLLRVLRRLPAKEKKKKEEEEKKTAEAEEEADRFFKAADFDHEDFGSDADEEEEVEVAKPKKKLEEGKKALRVAKQAGLALHEKVTFSDSDEKSSDSGTEGPSTSVAPSFALIGGNVKQREKDDRKAFLNIAKNQRREEKKKRKRQVSEVQEAEARKRRRRLGIASDEEEQEDDECDAPRLSTGEGSGTPDDISDSNSDGSADSDLSGFEEEAEDFEDEDEDEGGGGMSIEDEDEDEDEDSGDEEEEDLDLKKKPKTRKNKGLDLDDVEKIALGLIS